MNPLAWKPAHRLALAIFVVIGAMLGALLGYFVSQAWQAANGLPFDHWLRSFWRNGVPAWALFGALVAGAAVYARHISRL